MKISIINKGVYENCPERVESYCCNDMIEALRLNIIRLTKNDKKLPGIYPIDTEYGFIHDKFKYNFCPFCNEEIICERNIDLEKSVNEEISRKEKEYKDYYRKNKIDSFMGM